VLRMDRGSPRRDIWVSKAAAPPPGSYDPTPPLSRPKRWTSRLRNLRPTPVIQLKRTLAKSAAKPHP